MNTLTADSDHELQDPSPEQLPGRPRRRLLNRLTVPLLALLLAAAGFLVGIEVEKSHGGTGTTAAAGLPASRPSAAGGFPGAAARGGARFGGSGRGFGGGSFGGGTTGTVSSVSGRTIYLKTTTGNTIKVRLTSATKLTKQLSVHRGSIHPGDSLTVSGISGSGGSVKASSVTDAGSSSSTS